MAGLGASRSEVQRSRGIQDAVRGGDFFGQVNRLTDLVKEVGEGLDVKGMLGVGQECCFRLEFLVPGLFDRC